MAGVEHQHHALAHVAGQVLVGDLDLLIGPGLVTAIHLVGFDAVGEREVEQAFGAAPFRQRLHGAEEIVGSAGRLGQLLHRLPDVRRAQALGGERAPHLAGAAELPLVLVLGALGDFAPQLRPVRLEGVDQRADGVGRDRAVTADTLRLPQRRPEFR